MLTLPSFVCYFQERNIPVVVIDSCLCLITGSKREAEDRIVPRNIDADDSDVEVKSDDERSVSNLSKIRWKASAFNWIGFFWMYLHISSLPIGNSK